MVSHSDSKIARWAAKDAASQKNGPHATVYLINGDRYIGEWKRNLRHGKGMHIYKGSGHIYEGEWENDMRHGYGTLSVPVSHSSKVLSLSTGVTPASTTSQTTSPKKGRGDGRGAGLFKGIAADEDETTSHSDSASIFESGGSKSTKKGKGSSGGDKQESLRKVYAGEWKTDLRHGYGTYFYDDGGIYEGKWSLDMKEGWGKMTYADGSVYEGEWYREQRHGQGILLLPNGDRYEGMWLNGEKEGPGRFVYKSKRQVLEGEWAKGVPKCGTLRDLPTMAALNSQKIPLPKLCLENPEEVLENERNLIHEERVERMMGVKVCVERMMGVKVSPVCSPPTQWQL